MANSPALVPSRNVRPLVVTLLGLVALIGLLAVHSAANLHHRLSGPLPYPRRTDVESIQGWMTVPFVARRYRVPSEGIFQALDIQPEGNQRRSLDDLAMQQGRALGVEVAAVRATVEDYQVSHPPGTPTGVPPGTVPTPSREAQAALTRGAE